MGNPTHPTDETGKTDKAAPSVKRNQAPSGYRPVDELADEDQDPPAQDQQRRKIAFRKTAPRLQPQQRSRADK